MVDKSKLNKLSRAAFIQGAWTQSKSVIRPPWSVDESIFLSKCKTSCNSCVSVCPEKIIVIGRGKYAQIDFSKGECTFCEQCLDSCNYGALEKQDDSSTPWTHKAVIKMKQCITQQSVVCRSCSEMCEVAAITFYPVIGGVSSPELNTDICNGCGACINICPSNAIFIESLDVDQEVSK